MNTHALIWITVTLTIVSVIISLLLTYKSIQNQSDLAQTCVGVFNNENYWPEPYFTGNYTQNNKGRYFDYRPLPIINRIVDFGKIYTICQ